MTHTCFETPPPARLPKSGDVWGIVLYTLLEDDLAGPRLEIHCRELSVPCLSILGPVLALLQSYLGTATSHRVGAQHTLNAEYFKRIDALNYTMLHDDGQHIEDLEEANVVLVGVKTPTSIYLANRGVKTGNVPLVPGIIVGSQVEDLARPHSPVGFPINSAIPGFRSHPPATSPKAKMLDQSWYSITPNDGVARRQQIRMKWH